MYFLKLRQKQRGDNVPGNKEISLLAARAETVAIKSTGGKSHVQTRHCNIRAMAHKIKTTLLATSTCCPEYSHNILVVFP